jgi:hypothetical protein
MWQPVATFLIAVTLSASCGGTRPASRLSRIRQRGALVCGVFPPDRRLRAGRRPGVDAR